jgi:hypothetical protein
MNQNSSRRGNHSSPPNNANNTTSSDLSKVLHDKSSTRHMITSLQFDPILFLEQQINNHIALESGDPESKLLQLFDGFTSHFHDLSVDIEKEYGVLQEVSENMENILFEELDDHVEKLKEVHRSVDNVKVNFENASDNAVKIGSRLQNSEKERLNIVKSQELLSYIREFQNCSDEIVDGILGMNSVKLKEILPKSLKNREWNEISKILHDLKKIISDLTSEDILKAQKVISNISEVVENELLGQFDVILETIMENNSNLIYGNTGFGYHNSMLIVDETLIDKARHLTECLHLFNNGQSLQKRYIFSVIQKRIPHNVFMNRTIRNGNEGNFFLNKMTNALNTLNPVNLVGLHGDSNDSDDKDDDMSSAGASDNGEGNDRNHLHLKGIDEETKTPTLSAGPTALVASAMQKAVGTAVNILPAPVQHFLGTSNNNDHEISLIDNLSNLFSIIDKVCKEQFEIIRKIFPSNTIARVTRLLVQRIFGDPAFGIQAKVDAILCPQPPLPPLPLADYLDALLVVREKLSALHLLLIECSLDPALMGMGSESESLRKAKNEGWIRRVQQQQQKVQGNKESGVSDVGGGGDDKTIDSAGSYHHYHYNEEDNDEKIRSDAEIKEFLEEQV